MSAFHRAVLISTCILLNASSMLSQKIANEQWQTFSSPVAGFSALYPGEPRESASETSLSAFYAEDVKVYSASVGSDAGLFSITERIYPHPIDLAEDLPRFESFAARNLHGQINSRKDVTINGLRGSRISITFTVVGEVNIADQLLLVSDNRLFQLMAMGGSAPLDASDVDRFFTSIKVTGQVKDWKRSRSDPKAVVEKSEPDEQQITNGITGFECPKYPAAAKKNHLQGRVEIQVTTDGQKITDLKAKGHPLLAEAATENVRTWKFSDTSPRQFTVRYLYTFEGEYDPDPVYKCRAKLKLPESVEVSTSF